MSHGEFEKQVRDKMNEIHLQPSEAVWNRVEQGLDAGKKRRRMILWVPLAGILVMGLLWITNPFRQQRTLVQNKESVKHSPAVSAGETLSSVSPSATENKGIEAEGKSLSSNKSAENVMENSLIEEEQKSNINPHKGSGIQNIDNSSDNRVNQTLTRKAEETGLPTIGVPQTKNENSQPGNINPQTKNEINQPVNRQLANRPSKVDLPGSDAIIAGGNNGKTDERNISGVIPVNTLKSSKSLHTAWKQLQLPAFHIPEGQTKKLVDNNISKYSFSVNVAGGLSQEQNGRLLGFSNSNVADFQTPLYSSPNTRYKAAPIDPGVYISAGIGVERKLGDKWALLSGLQYSRFSNSVMVGNRMQQERQVFTGNSTPATISNYYTPAPIRRYTMHYDFIEVPLSLQYMPAKAKMKLHAGSSVSALLNSNALHFDAANGIYFKDNDLLNKMQVSVSTGIQFRIPVKNLNRLYLGPAFRYQVSGMLKDNSNEKHLWSGAIQASWKLK